MADTTQRSFAAPAGFAEPFRLRERWGARGLAYRCAVKPLGGWPKRAFDIVVASLALILLAPALVLIAGLIRLETRGPAIFKQRRAGFRGRVFRIYKFRTMTTAEDGRELVQAKRGDSRITRLGWLLRRTSIDELPQLVNVLKGDMSLVGPRPHAILHEHCFRRFDSAYMLRRMARPGITGLAQTSGARGETESEEKVAQRIALDLAYIRRWSLWLDVLILLRTVRVLFGDSRAV